MKIIAPSYEIMFIPDITELLQRIELAGRTCYKSEDKITDQSARAFVRRIIASGHLSVIEHIHITIKFIIDRGVSHELVRHRLASYSQESTRYANYSKNKFGNEITVIRPCFWEESSPEYAQWKQAMADTEKIYLKLIDMGARPEQARSVLPNSLKTEVVMTCNLREMRHILALRCSKAAHPQIREVMQPLLKEMHEKIPVIFDDVHQTIFQDIQKREKDIQG
ncbi:MAG: FAD-dependent thymidylate synthase [Candidatus Magnetomorum sp.]|nr:FAD-dependent thymidylate synthase [Candidatus Magnetomorum sp.]